MRGLEQIPWLYDVSMTVMEKTGMAEWRNWLAQGSLGRTLDLGCGTGRNLSLMPPGARAVGVDPEVASLERARKRAPNAMLVRASAHALPFRDGAFDTVLCGLVLCSIPDANQGLAEASRVLAPNGQLRALEHVRGKGAMGWVQDQILPAWKAVMGGCHCNRETENAVEAAGFAIQPDGRRSEGVMRRFTAKKKR
ncbi:MAG: class I SAM-dependent methyltransferase [Deltaproteobacteria bacterium]|nr:class I SAM-dependent methyltransferase [Deltaproteobacteria bacterium]